MPVAQFIQKPPVLEALQYDGTPESRAEFVAWCAPYVWVSLDETTGDPVLNVYAINTNGRRVMEPTDYLIYAGGADLRWYAEDNFMECFEPYTA